jgi:hypothetical protein
LRASGIRSGCYVSISLAFSKRVSRKLASQSLFGLSGFQAYIYLVAKITVKLFILHEDLHCLHSMTLMLQSIVPSSSPRVYNPKLDNYGRLVRGNDIEI